MTYGLRYDVPKFPTDPTLQSLLRIGTRHAVHRHQRGRQHAVHSDQGRLRFRQQCDAERQRRDPATLLVQLRLRRRVQDAVARRRGRVRLRRADGMVFERIRESGYVDRDLRRGRCGQQPDWHAVVQHERQELHEGRGRRMSHGQRFLREAGAGVHGSATR